MSTQRPDSEENDPIWNLLDASEPQKASPAFAQDVLRRVRQLDSEQAAPWWKKLFAPAPLAVGGLAVAAAITAMALLPNQGSDTSSNGAVANNETPVENVTTELDEAFAQELLYVAVEEPDLFSNAELLAMLY